MCNIKVVLGFAHCDIKPDNLMLSSHSHLIVTIDVGCSGQYGTDLQTMTAVYRLDSGHTANPTTDRVALASVLFKCLFPSFQIPSTISALRRSDSVLIRRLLDQSIDIDTLIEDAWASLKADVNHDLVVNRAMIE